MLKKTVYIILLSLQFMYESNIALVRDNNINYQNMIFPLRKIMS